MLDVFALLLAGSAAQAALLTPADEVAIFRAINFRQVGDHWESGCNDPSVGAIYEPGAITPVGDLNGDGREEVFVTEGGTYCFGNTGTAFWLVSQQANGDWQALASEVGIPIIQTDERHDGWPDIEIGGPGFCFPVLRWNGAAYAQHHFAYEGKPCTS